MYGTILAKMWRVYHIFHDPSPNKAVSLYANFTVECTYTLHKTVTYIHRSLIVYHQCPFLQIIKTWHLLCVVAIINAIGVILLLGKTVAQAVIGPELLTDSERPYEITVSFYFKVQRQ